MANYNSWTSEERYFDICPMCRNKITAKADDINKKSRYI